VNPAGTARSASIDLVPNERMKLRVIEWKGRMPLPSAFRAAAERRAFNPAAERAAARILEDVRLRGDSAVAKWTAKLDGVKLTPSRFRVSRAEVARACRSVDRSFINAVERIMERVARFADAEKPRPLTIPSGHGGRLGEIFKPLDRVGIYVPGGSAPLASTVLMTAVFARAAGVPEIVACTPCSRNGTIAPELIYCLRRSGAEEIYRIGGPQAIGMMAYGTQTVKPVQKIVGPGGPFVTAAKRLVYGLVSLDLVAGPSEIAILADDSADPRLVAADLLSQCEHGSGEERALLVTDSRPLAEAVAIEIPRQTALLSRRDSVRRVTASGLLIVVVPDLASGMALCNAFAPEHFEIITRNPRRWLREVRCAGAVFLGPWSPESAGDYAAGPSHVLPTGGAAAMFSGLRTSDFMRRISFVEFTRRDLQSALPDIEAMGKAEGLDAHVRSARARFPEAGRP